MNNLACTRPNCSWNFSPRSEPARDVSIEIRPGDLQTLFADFELPEFLAADDDYVCQACGDLVQKNIRVQPVGRAMLLHLKRFAFEHAGRKRSDAVTFPRILQFGTARYEFSGMVEHQGPTMRGGHNVAYVNSSGSFLHCNDDAPVREVSWEYIASQQAYLLAYVRADA